MLELPLDQAAPRRAIYLAGIAALFAATQLTTFNSYIVIFLRDDLFITVLIITIIVFLRNALQIFFRVPLGDFTQIIGRKPLMLIGHFCLAAALLLLFLSTDWVLPLLATVLIALGMSAFWPSIFSLLSDFTPKTVGESNGKIFALWDVGIICASLVSKNLLDGLNIDLQLLFLIIGTFGILSGFFTIFILPESLVEKNKKRVESIPKALFNSTASMLSSLLNMSRLKGMLEVYSFQFVLAFLGFMVLTFFPVLIVERGFTQGTVSEILFWATLVLLWFKPRLGKITDRFSFGPIMTVLLFFSSSLLLALTLVTELWLFIIIYIFLFGSVITGFTAVNGETARRSPDIYRGTAMGALGVWLSTGRAVSTIVLGPVWDIFSLEAVFLATAFGVILITPFLYLAFRFKKRKKTKTLKYGTIQ
ncbi:MAG: MFS transporter [Promethearchaeota archaeon]